MQRRFDFVLVRILLALGMIAAVGESNAQQKAAGPGRGGAGGVAEGGGRAVRRSLSIGQDGGGKDGTGRGDDRRGVETGGRVGGSIRAAEDRAGDRVRGGRCGVGAAGCRETGGAV